MIYIKYNSRSPENIYTSNRGNLNQAHRLGGEVKVDCRTLSKILNERKNVF